MRMPRTTLIAAGLLLGLVGAGSAQDSAVVSNGAALNVGVGGVGISLGNSHRWTGLRFNVVDRGVERIDGVNVTFWRPKHNEHAVYNGLSVGLAPGGGRFTGITVGIVGAVAEHDMAGINVGGVGLVANGALHGINVGGVGLVADGSVVGLNVGGVGAVTQGSGSTSVAWAWWSKGTSPV
jgi:hypothetical protein